MTVFKKTLSAVAICAAFLASSHAMAATDVTLKVTGTLTPAACTPALSGDGEVAFGTMSTSVIANAPTGNGLVQLGQKNITLTVSCEAATTVGFTTVDNRAASAVALSETAYLDNGNGFTSNNSYFGFGLGQASNEAKIGAYSISATAADTTADASAVSLLASDDSGATWRTGAVGTQVNNGSRIFTVGAVGSIIPKLFTELSMPLTVTVGVQPKSVLGGDAITLDGNATLSLVYL